MADFSAWEAYKAITVQDANVDGNLTDFPCLVVLDADSDVGGRSQSAGQDLRFTLSDGTTQLKHEIENFAIATGDASGNIWVKVPSVAASGGASIRMYYGNDGVADGQDAANVWDSDYEGVYHLSEGDSTDADYYKDSTSNNRHGTLTDADGDSVQANGKIHKCMDLDGDADYIKSSAFNLGDAPDMTMECWAKPANADYSGKYLLGYGDTAYPNHHYSLIMGYLWGQKQGLMGSVYDGSLYRKNSDSDDCDGSWHHYAMVVDWNSSMTLYKDGASLTCTTTDSVWGTASNYNDAANRLRIGAHNNASSLFNAPVDEVRISSALRSTDWLKFEHANVNEADNELSWGAEVAQGGFVPYPRSVCETMTGGLAV